MFYYLGIKCWCELVENAKQLCLHPCGSGGENVLERRSPPRALSFKVSEDCRQDLHNFGPESLCFFDVVKEFGELCSCGRVLGLLQQADQVVGKDTDVGHAEVST